MSSVSLAQNGMLGVGVLVELRKVRICKIRCATGSANKVYLVYIYCNSPEFMSSNVVGRDIKSGCGCGCVR